jgi:hypothetical protein
MLKVGFHIKILKILLDKKGAAPAKDPKKKGQEDEVSPEEKARLEQE